MDRVGGAHGGGHRGGGDQEAEGLRINPQAKKPKQAEACSMLVRFQRT